VSHPEPLQSIAPNLFDLTGKVALVTGGNGGIGLGIARGLARAGARIAIAARNTEKMARAARELEAKTGVEPLALTADLAQPVEIERTARAVLDRFGRIDILFNNAGTTVRKPPQELTLEEWQSVHDVNLTAAFLMSKAVYPAMKQAGAGKIVNIGSLASLFGSSYACAYASSKGAIVQLTRSLALSWATDGIQVNAILPGWFETEMTDGARKYVPGLYEHVISRAPAGRWAQPDDMAGTAIWLASPASDFVTGIVVPVDGGYSAAL
jgi:2-deoxy-D-gluconate 3-dehydrogenase